MNMKKNISKEAIYERMRLLAKVDKNNNTSKNNTLGTLIDYKRAADGIAYGIVKENHHYYIKKAGFKKDPTVSDFVYIGGIANIKEYQYKTLSEAEKNRNMILSTISESTNIIYDNKSNKFKKIINESNVDDEINKAEEKLKDAEEIATKNTNTDELSTDSIETELSLDTDTIDTNSNNDDNIEKSTNSNPVSDDTDNDDYVDNKTDVVKGIEKNIGKLTNKIRNTELTPVQVKSFVNSFLSAFKDKFTEINIEDRKLMADKILKVIPDKEIDDIKNNININEEQCSTCGSFVNYAESRGYNAEFLMECSIDEMANLISGYGNAYNDGLNDGDFKTVALIIKIINPKIIDVLKNDYGHNEYANKLSPIVQSINKENIEENIAHLNELFGGLKGAFKQGVQPIKQAGQAVSGSIIKGAEAVKGAMQQAGNAMGQYTQSIKQAYHSGEIGNEVKKLETIANNLGIQIAALNNRLVKAGKEPINPNSLLTTIKNQMARGNNVNITNKIHEIDDTLKFESQPTQIKETDDSDVDNGNINKNNVISPDSQTIGIVKPTKSVNGNVNIDINGDKDVNVTVNESEKKVRAYIRKKLEEMSGIRKPSINESVKSEKLKQLDKLIEKQYIDIIKNNNLDEFFDILSSKKKYEKLDKTNNNDVRNFFKEIFSNKLNPNLNTTGMYIKAFNNTPTTKLISILDTYFDDNKNGDIAVNLNNKQLKYTKKSPLKQTNLTGGFNAY